MGCSASYEEPPRQQPTTKKPTAQADANLHPNYPKQPTAQPQQQQQVQQQQQQPPPPQQQQQQAQQNPPETKKNVNPTEVNKETLTRYLELEKEIHRLEGKNVIKALKAKADALATQETHVKTLEENYANCVEATKKEKADVDQLGEDGVGGLVARNETLAEEQEEYVEALNKQEIAKKELDQAIQQRDLLKADLEKMSESAKHVNDIYDQQEDLLAGIFNGDYGSALENTLEGELDLMIERKQRIGVAKYKWQNGRVLIQYAVNQLGFAVKKWIEVHDTPKDNAKVRYTLATETRNNLVAANQNITTSKRYLSSIGFPYCKPAEMETLTRATNNIYTDMQTQERHAHALNVYNVTHKRAAALLQWFDHVIKNTIVKDSAKANKEALETEKALQEERIKLIKEKARELLGEDVNMEVDTGTSDGEDEEEEQELMALAAKTGGDGEENIFPSGDGQGDTNAESAPSPLPMDELAPAPSNDDLFGNIDDLKKQHEKEMEEFDRAQELNKARVEQGLQDKLRHRRSRRRRAQASAEE